ELSQVMNGLGVLDLDPGLLGEEIERGVCRVAGRVLAGVDVQGPVGEVEGARFRRLVPHPAPVRDRGLLRTADAAGGEDRAQADRTGALERRSTRDAR